MAALAQSDLCFLIGASEDLFWKLMEEKAGGKEITVSASLISCPRPQRMLPQT